MPSERVDFPTKTGHTLAARLELPDGPARACALFAHCFTCTKDSLAAARIARALSARGVAVLRFDFTGLGGSEGEFANTNLSSNLDDLVAAAEYVAARFGRGPELLVGHSLGGAAVLAAAARIPGARAVATIGAPSDPGHVRHLLADQEDAIREGGEAEVTLAGRRFRVRQQLLDDIAEQPIKAAIAGLGRPLLVMHAPRDQTVGIDHASRIFTAARHPKSFLSLDDADHLISRRADADYVAEVLSAWASRFIGEPDAGVVAGADEVTDETEGTVVVEETGQGAFQQTVEIGRHRLLADEPRSVGGDDTGPGPYDFLLAGLGACTSMTMRMYARRKQWPLEGVRVTLTHSKIHARDCEDCETKAGKVDLIERAIEITGPLSDDQRARILAIADKCPVHRTLHSEIKVRTTVVE